MPDPKKNVAYSFDLALVDSTNRPQFKVNPTLAVGDFKVAIDEGALTNLTTLPTVTPAGGRNVKVSLSAAEMNGDRIVVQGLDASGAEWDDVLVAVTPTVQTIDDVATTLGALEVIALGYQGDLSPGGVIDMKFLTVKGGVLTSLVGSPAVSMYKDNSATPSTAGLTLTTNVGSITGLNNLRVLTAADGTFYSGNAGFTGLITTGTVGGLSAVGWPVGALSLNARSALRPTTAGATIDVDGFGFVTTTGGLTDASIAAAVWAATTRSITDKLGFELSSAGIIALWAAAVRELSASGNTAVATATATAVASALAAAFAAIPDAVLDEAVEGVVTLRESLRLANAANGGEVSGAAPGAATVVVRDVADTKPRITASTDANGNRTAVTLDLT